VDWAIWQNGSTAPDQVLDEHHTWDYGGTSILCMMSVTYRRTTASTECDRSVTNRRRCECDRCLRDRTLLGGRG
jgi:hypothetical protein